MMHRLAVLVAVAAMGCGSSTTKPDSPQPSPSPLDISQHKPGDDQIPGTTVPPKSPAVGGGGAPASPSPGGGGGDAHCSDAAPAVACGTATARCTDSTYSCSGVRTDVCSSSAIDCVYCPGPLCTGGVN